MIIFITLLFAIVIVNFIGKQVNINEKTVSIKYSFPNIKDLVDKLDRCEQFSRELMTLNSNFN